MHLILEFENQAPQVKEALLSYVAKLRHGRRLAETCGLVACMVIFSTFLTAPVDGIDPTLANIFRTMVTVASVMLAVSPVMLYIARRSVFSAFVRLLECGVSRAEIDHLAETAASGHRGWHAALPAFWWHPQKS